MLRVVILINLILLSLGGCSAEKHNIFTPEQAELLWYEAYNEPNQDIKIKKYKALINVYLPLAEKGNSRAQYVLGDIYDRGLAGNFDIDKGLYWIKKAADNGNIDAMIRIAMEYENGEKTNKDFFQAKHYFMKAAQLNNSDGKLGLGSIYLDEGDIDKSMILLEESAEQDNINAQFKLGLIYCDGDFVAQDYGKCNYYWGKAADLGHLDAAFNYAINLETGRGEVNLDKSILYYEKASNWGEGKASYNLSLIYKNKKLNRMDKVKSEYYLNLAKKQGWGKEKVILQIE